MIRSENLRSGYLQDDVEEYLYKLLPERDAVVSEMEAYAQEHRVPIIGPAVARLLALLVQVSGAKRIFEMGSAIGYSTVWLARAAGTQRKVFYTDGDPEKAKRAQVYFRMADVAKRIEVNVGDDQSQRRVHVHPRAPLHQYCTPIQLRRHRLSIETRAVVDGSGKVHLLAIAREYSVHLVVKCAPKFGRKLRDARI